MAGLTEVHMLQDQSVQVLTLLHLPCIVSLLPNALFGQVAEYCTGVTGD